MIVTLVRRSCRISHSSTHLTFKDFQRQRRSLAFYQLGVLTSLALLLFATPKSWAFESHPNLARHADDPKTVEDLGWDQINLFNGNLSLAIPIGSYYPLSESFGYQLQLHYNSNIWDLKATSSSVNTALARSNSNAGLGWDLSLGRLIAPSAAANFLATSMDGTPRCRLRLIEAAHRCVPSPRHNRSAAESLPYAA
jgi:hypothetical protein